MKYSLLYILAIFFIIIMGSSCRKEFNYTPSTGNLSFSKDTVYLDTIFSNISTSTYGFKVYNKSAKDIEIPSIELAKGIASDYRLNVDGQAEKSFRNIPLLAKDSLYVFVETTVNTNNTKNEFLYTDAILFDAGIYEQRVELVTLVKDAIFLYPKLLANRTKETIVLDIDDDGKEIVVEGFMLADNQLHFTAEKPYVIYGYAAVPDGKILNIDPGTRVHFHQNSGILVRKNASISINGLLSKDELKLENEVIFEGDRLENNYNNTPGQWGTIWIASGSLNNRINYLTIKNATIGLLVEGATNLVTTTLLLTNSQIYNSQKINLLAIHAKIDTYNSIFANAGNTSVHLNIGGDYSFKHNTIANYWTNGFRTGFALEIDNFSTTKSKDLVKANFVNCIIDGTINYELKLTANTVNSFNYKFTNCMLKFNDINNYYIDNEHYNFKNNTFYDTLFLNLNASFFNPTKNKFWLTNDSQAINKAKIIITQEIPLDIKGKNRGLSPDIGAYELQ